MSRVLGVAITRGLLSSIVMMVCRLAAGFCVLVLVLICSTFPADSRPRLADQPVVHT
jgi:hypothetical protein